MLLLLQKKERLFDFVALIRHIRDCPSNKKPTGHTPCGLRWMRVVAYTAWAAWFSVSRVCRAA